MSGMLPLFDLSRAWPDLRDDAMAAFERIASTGAFRLGDVRHVFADASRARDVLGFEARIGFREGVAEFARAKLR